MVNTKEEKNCKEISAFVHVKKAQQKENFLSFLSLSLSFVVLLFLSFWLKHTKLFLNQKEFIIKKSERESFKKRDVFLLLLRLRWWYEQRGEEQSALETGHF